MVYFTTGFTYKNTSFNWILFITTEMPKNRFFGGFFQFGPVRWSLRATCNRLRLPVHPNRAKKPDRTRPAYTTLTIKAEASLTRLSDQATHKTPSTL